jgi:hypothetical protein
MVKYSLRVGNTFITSTASIPISTAQNSMPSIDRPRWRPAAVTERSDRVGIAMGFTHWKPPMRLGLPKFIQTKKALPTMFSSGTKPQYRESSELSRLSPIMK